MSLEPLTALEGDPQNARSIVEPALEGLGASIDLNGDSSGVVWNETTGQLVAGHQRIRSLREEGASEWIRQDDEGVIVHPKTGERFRVRIVHWTPEQQRLANLAANNPYTQGTYTAEAGEQLERFADDDAFTDLRLDKLAKEIAKQNAQELEEVASSGMGGAASDGPAPVEADDQLDELTQGFAVVVECPTLAEAKKAGDVLASWGHSWRALYEEAETGQAVAATFELRPAHAVGTGTLDPLQADPTNPRVIGQKEIDGLRASMERFGDLSGITWNERTGLLVTGHRRVEALRRRGVHRWVREGDRGYIEHPQTGERFEVRVVDWDARTARLAGLVANNPHIQGKFTTEAARQLRALESDSLFGSLRLSALAEELAPALKRLESQIAAQEGTGFALIVEVATEKDQLELVEKLLAEGYKCRALI